MALYVAFVLSLLLLNPPSFGVSGIISFVIGGISCVSLLITYILSGGSNLADRIEFVLSRIIYREKKNPPLG